MNKLVVLLMVVCLSCCGEQESKDLNTPSDVPNYTVGQIDRYYATEKCVGVTELVLPTLTYQGEMSTPDCWCCIVGTPYGGLFYPPDNITLPSQQCDYDLEHEFVHYLLYSANIPDNNHEHPAFRKCAQFGLPSQGN